MKTEWKGHYFDGEFPVKHDADITLSADSIIIELKSRQFEWKFDRCHIVDDITIDDYARVENLDDLNQKLVVYDSDFPNIIRSKFAFKKKFSRSSLNTSKLRRYGLWSFLLILIAAPLTYFFALPKMSDLISEKMPVWAEKRLAENYINLLAPEKSRCKDERRLEKLNLIMNKLLDSSPDTRYKFNLTVVKSDIVNAFALPGGDIVFFSALIEESDNPEQVAGVMAHELQHVINRHGTKGLVKQLSFDVILSALTGSSDGGNAAVQAVKLAGILKYGRDFEEEADREGVKMMIKSNINPNGMVEFFEKINNKEEDLPKYLEYFSTHPKTVSRIDNLKDYANRYSDKPETLFTKKEWEDIKKICSDEKDVEKFEFFFF